MIRRWFSGVALAAVTLVVSGGAMAPTGAAASIDPVQEIRATSPTSADLREMSALEQVQALARCVQLSETQTYCLFRGFVDEAPDYAALARSMAEPQGFNTGDLSIRDWVAQRVAMSNSERINEEVTTIEDAILAVPKADRIDRQLAWIGQVEVALVAVYRVFHVIDLISIP